MMNIEDHYFYEYIDSQRVKIERRMTVQSPDLNSARGYSIAELMIAAGILAGIVMAALVFASQILAPMRNLNKNVYEAVAQDFSVRGLQFSLTTRRSCGVRATESLDQVLRSHHTGARQSEQHHFACGHWR